MLKNFTIERKQPKCIPLTFIKPKVLRIDRGEVAEQYCIGLRIETDYGDGELLYNSLCDVMERPESKSGIACVKELQKALSPILKSTADYMTGAQEPCIEHSLRFGNNMFYARIICNALTEDALGTYSAIRPEAPSPRGIRFMHSSIYTHQILDTENKYKVLIWIE